MGTIERLVRQYLLKDAQCSTELQSFCQKIEENSLNMKVLEALAFRKQGHFDKAMLNIAEANRNQMIAIRTIQRLIGNVRGERFPGVIFEKFRQFEPFEIGISDADAVLTILAKVGVGADPKLKEDRLNLHDCEIQRKDEEDYLSHMENRLGVGSGSDDVFTTKGRIDYLTQILTEMRVRILEKIFDVGDETLNEMQPGIAKDRIFLELSQNIFLVIVSPILTKPAACVDTEK